MTQKVKAITDFALATNISDVWHIIGLIGYYRKFFPIFSEVTQPLNGLTKKNLHFKWTEECQKSLDNMKQIITTNPILAYPDKSTIFLWTVVKPLGMVF